MDCPACGLVNSEEAAECKCGHRFEALAIANTEHWQPRLAWRQKMAAYWSIAWPAQLGWFLVLGALASRYATPDEVTRHVRSINLFAFLSFFAIQAPLVQRLVRKNYRSFRIYAVHPDGSQTRRLSLRENSLVVLCVLGFQASFILALLLIAAASGGESARAILTLEIWLRFLVAGPYSIAVGLRVRYPGFRLQASALRYI